MLQSQYASDQADPSAHAGRYVLYVRKSTEQDERQTQSLDSQKSRAFELAARNGKQIIEVLEESKSAKEPGRPVFNEMIRRIDAGEIDGVIAWHPDRLARNEIDAAAITFRIRKRKLKELLFVEYTFINSPEGIMMLQMALSQGQYQVSKLAIEVTRGIQDKIALGWYPHRAPLGYVNDTHKLKGQKSISSDPERFTLLQRAWQLLLTGSYNVQQVREILNDSWGFRTPITPSGRGGEPLAKTTFYRLLGNVFYAGQFVHGGKVYHGAHEPMVTLKEYQKVQELLRREQLGSGEQLGADTPLPTSLRLKASDMPFTGLIRCEKCGSQVTVTTKIKPSGKSYTYYHCSNSRGDCPRSGVREDQLEMQIDALLEHISIDDDFYAWAIEDIERSSQAVRAVQEDTQSQRHRALEEIGKQLDALVGMRMRELLTDEEYTTRRMPLLKDREHLNHEVNMGEQGADIVRDTCLNAAEYMRNARDWLLYGDASIKRIVAKHLVSNWVLSGKKLLPELHPLMTGVFQEYPSLLAEKGRIELDEISSESTKKEALASIRSTWSYIWDQNRTLVSNIQVAFPDVLTLIKMVLEVR